MKTILAPIDFSDVSDRVVAEAATLARAVHGRVLLLHVIRPIGPLVKGPAILNDIAQITATAERNAAARLAKIELDLAFGLITADSVHSVGAPVALIIEEAERSSADCIVMGSHGHTALFDLLVGSTAHGVLLRAKCPVVIIPARKEVEAAQSEAKEVAAV